LIPLQAHLTQDYSAVKILSVEALPQQVSIKLGFYMSLTQNYNLEQGFPTFLNGDTLDKTSAIP
jgi:hypothetical protein